MERLLYYFARGIIGLMQMLPLDGVARVGRFGGGLFYYVDARHRRVARRNMAMCFSEKSPAEIHALAKENFKRIGENFACALKTASMDRAKLEQRIEVAGLEKLREFVKRTPRTSAVFAIGHFGNFEAYAQTSHVLPEYQFATTYRALKQPSVNGLLLGLRAGSGCLFFERRTEGAALRTAMRRNDLILGLLSDQHSGDHGLRLPFFGHDCNTSKAPAVFALRFDAPLFVAVCFRTRLAHWRIEVSEEIATHENGQPRSLQAIMRDVNTCFEAAVRRDPANWFWVHNRWKKSKLKPLSPKASDDDQALEEHTDPAGRSPAG